ncbi:MAG TPA: hypothetical protein VHO69_11640 [Phototrophicaceae bacterium]|nr:hypothetical protein [Phototrophicaceae bacterium]
MTKVTRQRYLAALRKLVEYLAIHHSGFEIMWRSLKRLKAPTEGMGGKERNKVALTPAQVEKILAYWRDEPDDGQGTPDPRPEARAGLLWLGDGFPAG